MENIARPEFFLGMLHEDYFFCAPFGFVLEETCVVILLGAPSSQDLVEQQALANCLKILTFCTALWMRS